MFVRMYLDGKFGKNPSDTNAFAASMFFACDRYISFKTDWLKDIEDPDTYVIANRYTSANAVHQLSKLPREEWDEFLKWLWDFEFSRLCLPVPDATIYLELPPVLSLSLVRSRSAETGRKMDIHELDTSYMEKCYDAALFSCKALGWKQIKCYEGDKIRTIDDISKQIYDEVSRL
jgi:dTMP kinase